MDFVSSYRKETVDSVRTRPPIRAWREDERLPKKVMYHPKRRRQRKS